MVGAFCRGEKSQNQDARRECLLVRGSQEERKWVKVSQEKKPISKTCESGRKRKTWEEGGGAKKNDQIPALRGQLRTKRKGPPK